MTGIRRSRAPHLTLRVCAAVLALAAAPACAQTRPDAEAAPQTPALGPEALAALVAKADSSRSKGVEGAPLTIYEVSDFQCPFCRQFFEETWPRIDSAYVQTGKARVVFLNLPLPIHAAAWPAAEAALCSGAQGKFWPMHDLLFQKQKEWGDGDVNARLEEYARSLSLDLAAFRSCTENDYVAQTLVNDVMQVSRAGMSGTPAFLLIPSDPAQRGASQALSGAVSFEEMSQQIEALLPK